MKTKFDTRQCAHVWAQLSQPYGEGSNVHFDGAVFYSYATPIAAFVPLKNGAKTAPHNPCLITSKSYSATTSRRHMPAVCRAVDSPHVFYVPDVGHGGGMTNTARVGVASDPKSWKPVHAANMLHLVASYKEHVARGLRLQSWGFAGVGDVLASLRRAATAIKYAECFKLRAPKLDLQGDAEKIWARCERLAAERAKPGYAADREAARVKAAEAKERREARARELAAADREKRIAAWYAGEIHSLPYGDMPHGASALLRVHRGEVQTSQGARVGVRAARKLLRHVTEIRAAGLRQEYAPGSLSIDAFPVREIAANGDIRVGCHFIAWHEIERIIPALNEA